MPAHRLDPAGRAELARLIVEDGLPPRMAAARFGVSESTARRWAGRWRAASTAELRDGRWMRSGPDAYTLAERSIADAEALMGALFDAQPAALLSDAPAPAPRTARPRVRARERVAVRQPAVTPCRDRKAWRRAGGVLVTLAFVPAGWVIAPAVAGRATPRAAADVAVQAAFSPAHARATHRDGHLIARARKLTLTVHRRPDGPVQTRLDARVISGHRIPIVVLVGRRSGAWLRVHLPTRPNLSTGWIRARDVWTSATPYELTVQLKAHRVTLRRDGHHVRRWHVGVGTAVTPTPTGVYFVTDVIRTTNPTGPYGPYSLGLSGHSPVLTRFGDGDGQIGIHGTDDPSALGSDVSHGCIRVRNAVIRRLARLLPLGTPVRIER